jgi:ABC-2 type transport system ATP-binding protein
MKHGSVSIFGHDLRREREKAKAHRLDSQSQFLTVRHRQSIYSTRPVVKERYKLALQRAEYCLKQMDLWTSAIPFQALVRRMKRRVMIAYALVHAPKLLILTSSPQASIEIRRSMWQMMQKSINKHDHHPNHALSGRS